jgi:similar to stage IV sporulation protein
MDLWGGSMVRLEYTSANVAQGIRVINDAGITLYRAEPVDDLTIRFSVRRQDYRALKKLMTRRGEQVQSVSWKGFYFTARRFLHRPVLLGGMILILWLTLFLPTRVLFVEVEGNAVIPERQILEQAAGFGLDFGTKRSTLRSEKLKNQLMQSIPELQWAGVNTIGCRAVISVRERTDLPKSEPVNPVSSIVAEQDGVIREMTIISGSPLCKPGDSVKKGQVLISGYTDLGLVIRAEQAQGEVFAETYRSLSAAIPENWQEKIAESDLTKKYGLIIGKKRINFYKGSGILDGTCGKMYTEYYLTLPGGFRLPIALTVERWTKTDYRSSPMEESEAKQSLSTFVQRQLAQQMVAGRVEHHYETISKIDGLYYLNGRYSCYEMIGRVRPEEITGNYENSGTYG